MPEERWIIQRRQGSYPTIAGVVDMLRIRWSTCSGFSGRHAPDSVVGMLRIMQQPSPAALTTAGQPRYDCEVGTPARLALVSLRRVGLPYHSRGTGRDCFDPLILVPSSDPVPTFHPSV